MNKMNIKFSLNRKKLISELNEFQKLERFPKSAEKWYPDRLFPERITIDIKGLHNAYTNSLRRVINSEVQTYILTFDDDNYRTNDGFLNNDYIRRNINLVPINQEFLDPNKKYYINVVNDADNEHKNVYTSDLLEHSDNKNNNKPIDICNSNIKLFDLSPKSYIAINNVHFISGKGENLACFNAAFRTVNIPMDDNSSSEHNQIRFETNGNIDPKNLVRNACLELISKIKNLQNYENTVQSKDDYYYISIKNEDDTLGYIFTKSAMEVFPNIKAITYTVSISGQSLIIKFKYNEPQKFIESTIKNLLNIYNELYKSIN